MKEEASMEIYHMFLKPFKKGAQEGVVDWKNLQQNKGETKES